MREIKFRFWDVLVEKYQDNITLGGDDKIFYRWGPDLEIETVIGSSIIPEQYTGLKDKNGQEIYEGDIVLGYKRGGAGKGIGVVQWNRKRAGFEIGGVSSFVFGTALVTSFGKLEILGNIHENPELIK